MKNRTPSSFQTPSDVTANALKEAYISIPEHLKRYVLGDMDSKDGPIKYVLNGHKVGEEQLNYWRERYSEHN